MGKSTPEQNKSWYERNKAKKRAYMKEYRKKNVQKTKEAQKKWNKKNKDHVRNYQLMYKYGITLEEFNKMAKEQNFKCYICEIEKDLVVDHCHKTGVVRKLLCCSCNTLVGKMENDLERLDKVLAYIEIPRA